jgi:hypothetical protein
MSIRSLLSILAAVSILTLTSPLPAPLHAAPEPDGMVNNLKAPPTPAAETLAGPLGPLALTQPGIYTYSLAARVDFTDHRRAPTWDWSGVQISARVPAAAVDGPVVVKTERGDSNNSSPFDVGASAVPSESGEGTTWAFTASGPITASTMWTENVLVTGDVTVTRGVTLTIAPGVTVFFAAHSDDQAAGYWPNKSELHVFGTLIAEGTPTAPIYFTSNAAVKAIGDWGAVAIRVGSTTSSLSNCVVHHAQHGLHFYSYNDGVGGTLSGTVSNCRISHNGSGVYVLGIPEWPAGGTVTVSPTIANNLITDNVEHGVYLEASSGYGTANNYAVVRNNVIANSSSGIWVRGQTWWLGHADDYPQILNNTIRNSASCGIYVQTLGSIDGSGADTDMQPTIEHNLLEDNLYNIYLYIESSGSDGTKILNPTLRYNTIRDAMNGITIDDGHISGTVNPTISHNVFYGMTGYIVNNVTARTITLGDNYWGDSEAEWDAGPQPGATYGNVVVGSHLTSSSPPILPRVEPAAAQPGADVILYGANFGPPPPQVMLPIVLPYSNY